MKEIRLPKWAVVLVLGAVMLQLAVDWAVPGEGTRIAAQVLREVKAGGEGEQWMLFPLWSWLVGLAGKDVAALAWVSVVSALVDVALVAWIFGSLFGAAVRRAKAAGAKGANEFPFAVAAGTLLSAVAFAFTPGLLAAATRVGPLMTALVPVLGAVALVVSVCWSQRGEDAASTLVGRMKRGKGWLLLAVGLVGYSAFELVLARRVFLSMAFPAVAVWLALGVLPAVAITGCIAWRWLVGKKAQLGAFGGWGLIVLAMATAALTSGKLDEGLAANRIVSRIIAGAEEGGKVAIVSDGTLDDLYFFMLPDGVKLISLAREMDPEYGRELSEWVQERGEDLAFAAELGPGALIDEWAKLDKPGFEAAVASVVNFFPTQESLEAAAEILKGMREGDPLTKYLRQLLGVCGNALGCRLIEKGDMKGAWRVFWTVSEKVDRKNYTALVNLAWLIGRGQVASKTEAEIVKRRRAEIEAGLKNRAQIARALRAGGRAYAATEAKETVTKAMLEATKRNGFSPEAQRFIAAVTNAPKDKAHSEAAREAIRNALKEGRIGIADIGGHLVTIDLALGDGTSAEKDALALLKANRRDPTANATIGAIAGARGDHERALRYLRRAIATGDASIGAKNDYAYSLMKLGRLDEAEPYAREAVKAFGESWILRETLAAILIKKGALEEGERELVKAEELAEKAGIPKGRVVSLEIDRARLLKAKGDAEHLKMVMRSLKNRTDLTDEQKAEVKRMDW